MRYPRGMTGTVPDSLIPYDEIVQEALRAVVGRVLGSVAETGNLPGGHHFYITFKTHAPGSPPDSATDPSTRPTTARNASWTISS
jgi:hypothetical protein